MKNEYPLTLKKIFAHLRVIRIHRWKVFCLCCRVGIPIQGLLHDLSKYSFVEFFETARYYDDGTYSPIKKCKEVKGYSMAWIHHKNKNKHHYEYWYDYNAEISAPMVPFRYFLEMVCDSFAAGMTYQGKNWTKEYQLSYWNRVKDYSIIHPNLKKLLGKVYEEVSEKGLNEVLKRRVLKEMYLKYLPENLQKK